MPLTDRDRRTLIVGGGILGVMLLGFFLFNMLAGGGGDEALPTLPPITAAPTGPGPDGSGTPTTTPTPGGQPPVFTGRDPFSIPPELVQTTPPDQPTGPTGGGTGPTGGTGPPPRRPHRPHIDTPHDPRRQLVHGEGRQDGRALGHVHAGG